MAETPEELRDEGAASVLEHSIPWKDRAATSIRLTATHTTMGFTSEDIVDAVGMPPNHPNAVGAAILCATRAGLIEWTGEVRKSKRPGCHAAMLKVWRGKTPS